MTTARPVPRRRTRHASSSSSSALLLCFGAVLLGTVMCPGCTGADDAAPPADHRDAPPTVPLAGVEAPLAAVLTERVAAVRNAPRDAEAWGALALTYDAHGFTAEALVCYERAATLAPNEPRWPYLGGTAAYMGDQASAIEWLDRAERRGSQHPPLFVRRGLGRLLVGDLDGARADLTRATTLDPTLVAGWLALARVELAGDDVEAALAALQRASDLGPLSGEVHSLYAEVHRRRGEDEAAAAALAKAKDTLGREPLPDSLRAVVDDAGVTLSWTRRRARAALERNDLEGALAEWARAEERAPGDPRARLGATELLLRANRVDEAKTRLEQVGVLLAQAGASAETDVRAQFEVQLGVATLGQGDHVEAARHFEAALALDPALHDARANLGLIRLREGNHAAGIELLRAASEGLGVDNPMRVNLLQAVVDVGAWHEAEALIAEDLAARPDDPLLVFLRGRVHAGTGRFAAAARDFARVAELEPTHETAPVNEARSYVALGDESRAAATLRAAHGRMPESRLIMQRLAWLLATTRDDGLADGELAKSLAKRVLGAAPKNPEYLTLTAAAMAAAGDFQGAVLHEEIALELLEKLPEAEAPPRRPELLAEMRTRLVEYKAGRRWREALPKSATGAPR
jgi:tetratricopeptide (TPR) repeat protein